jgi:glycosyltransferase involved in cell wall biosynthesis
LENKKKILLLGELYFPLIPWFLEDKDPQGVPAVYNLYNYLGNSEDYIFHSIIYNKEINRIKTLPNGSIIELKKFNFPVYYIWKFIVFFKQYFASNRKLKSDKYDLIYGLSTFATIAALVGRKNSVTSVGRIYGTILTKDVEQKNYFRLYTRFIFDVLAIKKPADYVLATLDGTEYDKVFNFFNKNKKVDLMYNGMEHKLREKLLAYKTPSVLSNDKVFKISYIARLEPYKRQHKAIEIIRVLKEKYNYTNVKLSIVGSGSQEGKLKELVNKYKLNDHVVFYKEVAHDEIPSFIEAHHAAMFFYEGGSLGNILWESALAGRLIITIDNAGTGTIFKDEKNCFILKESENFEEEMAAKINSWKGRDVSDICAAGRSTVSEKIKTWDQRFDLEFHRYFND